MASSREKLPLLPNEGRTSSENSSTKSLFPAFTNNRKNYEGNSSYGVIDITQTLPDTRQRKLRQPGGIATSPIIAVIAVTVGLVLILSITTFTSNSRESTLANKPLNAKPLKAQPLVLKAKPRLTQSSSSGHVDIDIPQGRLRGYKLLSRQGREYNAFYKVPYAEPPLGSLRFKEPAPPSSWSGLRDIPVVAPQCIQKEKYSLSPTPVAVGEEDCLYANIYTPKLPPSGKENPTELFPVMVYIHGGGLSGNGSRYSAEYFMDEDVVIITFQFRIGPFGLLTTGDEVIPANNAFKDQVQMLRWIKENIIHFNGDPNLVTIFGNSNGGMNVGHLLASPLASGLFHRAISQSGATLCASIPEGINEVAGKGTLEEVGKVLKCDIEDSQKFLDCLREKDAAEIALVLTPKAMYSLTIEDGDFEESTKFMPEKPYRMLESGRLNAVPYMIGNTNAEWYSDALKILQDANATKVLNERFEDFSYLFNLNITKEEMRKVKDFYFGDETIYNGTLKNLGNLFSDRTMVHCSYTSARFHARQASTYLYWLTKAPAFSYADKAMKGFPAKDLGLVFHADDLQFLFLYYGYPEIPNGDPEYFEYSKYLVKLWVHFARTGNPSMEGKIWDPVNPFGEGFANSTFWFELNDNPAQTFTPQRRMGFWDEFKHSQVRFDW